MNPLNHWFARYKEGDPVALSELHKELLKQAHAAIWRILHQERPDLASDAASNAILGLVAFNGKSEFSTWSYRIAINVAKDEQRRMIRAKEQSLVEHEREDVGCQLLPGGFAEASRELPQEDQALLEAFLTGHSLPQIATQMGLSRSVLYRRWAALVETLRSILRRRGRGHEQIS